MKSNFNVDENIQNLRNKIKISLLTCEKVLDDFSNITFIEKTLLNCENECYNKFSKLYIDNENNEFYNFMNLKKEFIECTNQCDDIYKKVCDLIDKKI